ncbi:MAG: type II/IV secretion system ATPase subunit [Candidatus Bathyarchaeia archaeon]
MQDSEVPEGENPIDGSDEGFLSFFKFSFISDIFGRLRDDSVPELLDEGVTKLGPEESFEVVESYYLAEPHSEVIIYRDPDEGNSYHYYVAEVELGEEELRVYDKLIKIISKELEPPADLEVDPYIYVREQAEVLAEKYKRNLGKLRDDQWDRVLYYLIRNVAGYGALDPLFRGSDIEDISCNGLYKPIYIWHRKYESIPTNLMFTDEGVFNDFIIKLAHKGSKHISSAHPILDATLPEKHRLAATFQREVSTQGSSFCIRKFREDPISIIDLIGYGTLPPRLAAYYWVLLENRMNFMIIGGTGAGKTSLLNAILSMIPPALKIITVEEVAELNPPHENWVSLTARKNYAYTTSVSASIELFDLVKLSLRYRPDYIIVGEVRGEEAFTLFQAIATGHGGLCTMHADTLDHAVKRLTSEPMNIADIYIPLMNIAMYISRVELPEEVDGLKFGRRIRDVWEILGVEDYNRISRWNPREDVYEIDLTNSVKLREIANLRGTSFQEILEDIDKRTELLVNLSKAQVRSQSAVTKRIQRFLVDRDPSLFSGGVPEPNLVESNMTIKDETYKVWRYPSGGYDPISKKKVGGRIVKRRRLE